MMSRAISMVFLGLVLLAGCSDQSFDADAMANEYCECMEKNGAHKDYYNARVICDSKFVLENKFFRIDYIDALYGRYMGTLSKEAQDSVNKFNHEFFMKVSEQCPYVFKADSIADDYLKKHR